jgi:hypothetical protein
VQEPDEPVVFWFNVGNEQLAKLPEEGVPKAGVVSDGLVERTTLPEPVELVTPVPPRAAERVPVVPATIGRPVAFVNVPDVGVPRAGATSVALSDNTTLPVPVEVATPVPPLATERVPVVPATIGRPVALVRVAEEGVPSAGVVSVGLVAKTNAPEPVSSVTAEAKLAEDGVAKNVATPVPSPVIPAIGRFEQLVNVPEAGVPNSGVVNDGLFKCVFCWAKFVPSLQTVIVLPAGMATPVPFGVVSPMAVEL